MSDLFRKPLTEKYRPGTWEMPTTLVHSGNPKRLEACCRFNTKAGCIPELRLPGLPLRSERATVGERGGRGSGLRTSPRTHPPYSSEVPFTPWEIWMSLFRPSRLLRFLKTSFRCTFPLAVSQ